VMGGRARPDTDSRYYVTGSVTRATLPGLSRNLSRKVVAMTASCGGCGKPLSAGSGVGRPARYHGPTCRQRARRARLAVDPERAALLAVADRAEHAALALRRALTSGQDPDSAAGELMTAVAELAALRGATSSADAAREAEVAVDVTESVTKRPVKVAPQARTRRGTHRESEASEPDVQTGSAQLPPPVAANERVDPETVSLQRSADYEMNRTWHVLTETAQGCRLVGSLRPVAGTARAWEAWTPLLLVVAGGPWKSRQDALVHLLSQHASRVRRGKTRGPR
jgi:hypothetical protein